MAVKKTLVAAIIALVGTIVAAAPFVAPFAFACFSLAGGGGFRFDFLMPGELAFLILGGSLAILAVALWTARLRVPVIAALIVALAAFFGFQWIAELTGLANGPARPGGWEERLVLAVYGLYALAALAVVVSGAILCRTLFRETRK